jgi:hypothetical protein
VRTTGKGEDGGAVPQFSGRKREIGDADEESKMRWRQIRLAVPSGIPGSLQAVYSRGRSVLMLNGGRGEKGSGIMIFSIITFLH